MTDADAVAAPPLRRRLRWWGLILGLTLLFAAGAVAVMLAVLKPAFDDPTAVDAADIRGITAYVLNRPDGGPDIGHPKDLFAVPAADVPKVWAVIRAAGPAEKERGIFLGELRVTLADGRRQTVRLYRAENAPRTPPVLRVMIGSRQYEGGPAAELVAALGGVPPPPDAP